MRIGGLQKLSLLDYPEKTAATIFTVGCNLRCPFCHNAPLVVSGSAPVTDISTQELFEFLSKRKGKLDGVCITGGEPLLQDGLEDLICRIKDMGFLVKLDTNGTHPKKLRELMDKGLLDYTAMDIKHAPSKYPAATGVPLLDIAPILESVALLKEDRVPYEFRTTLVKGLHSPEDCPELGSLLSGAKNYYLQNFRDSGNLVGFGLGTSPLAMESFSPRELEEFARLLSPYVDHLGVRT